MAQADSQGDNAESFKGLTTQKLFMLPQQTQKLWNAAANDAVGAGDGQFDGRDTSRVNKHITQWMAQADSQGDNAESFKGLTQKLYIVPQANVLTGDGQKIETSNGKEDVKAEKKVDSKAAAKVIKKNAAAAKKQAHMQALWNAAQDHDGSSLFPPTVVVPKGVPLEGKYIGYDAAKQVSYLPAKPAYKARTQQLWDAATNDQSLDSTRESMGMSSATKHSARKSRDLSGQPRNYLAGMDYHAPNYLGGYGW